MKLTDIQASGRVLGLDFIRISLAILIYAFHSSINFSCNYYWLDDFVRLGVIAMTAFFMLSGYSLHLSSSRRVFTKAGEIKQFYIKRLISILPLYYFVALTSVQSAFMSLSRCGIKYPSHSLVFRSLSGRSCPSASFC